MIRRRTINNFFHTQGDDLNNLTRVWYLNFNNFSYKLDIQENALNLDEASRRLKGGVYTTFRTYQHDKALCLQEHFDRLENSVKLQGRELVLPRSVLRDALRELISQFPGIDVRLRIHCSLLPSTHQIYLMAEPFSPYPPAFYENGVKALTLEMQRKNPVSKATDFIDLTHEIRRKKPSDVNEYLMIGSDQTLLEGMSSNIFVTVDRTIWTAERGILPGITRQMVLKVIAGLDLKIIFNGYPVKELHNIDELFITSASRCVMPVSVIDNLPVGNGFPGPITQQIRSEFEKMLLSELETI